MLRKQQYLYNMVLLCIYLWQRFPVQCFGTEDRVGPENFIPPSNSVYQFVVFRGQDILSLTILDPPPVAVYFFLFL